VVSSWNLYEVPVVAIFPLNCSQKALYFKVERDVTNLMLKALKYCDSGGVQDVMRQYRAATIHHRLASLFHNAFRSSQVSLGFWGSILRALVRGGPDEPLSYPVLGYE